jgi:alkaline phosphatase
MPTIIDRRIAALMGLALSTALAGPAQAEPLVLRLTPPSQYFSTAGAESKPMISRFFAGQKFDLQATVIPDDGTTITGFEFYVNGKPVGVAPAARSTVTTGLVSGLPAGTAVVSARGFSTMLPGVHKLSVKATQSDGLSVMATGEFEVVRPTISGNRTKNIIIMLGDGMGAGHRTAARIMQYGVAQGKAKGMLAMDTFPITASIMTASLNSIVTDSAPGMQNYVTGNKANNNQEGVFPDDTTAFFDNPRVEYLAEYLARTQGKKLGIVTTSDVFDATPASVAIHTQNRGAGTGIVDQFFDDRRLTGLTVLMGGGRKWFLPNPTNCPGAGCGTAAGFNGSARGNSTDYVLPSDIVAGWGAAPGVLDAGRDLIAEFQAAGWSYASDGTSLSGAPGDKPLLGLFSLSNMNIALDKLGKRRGTSNVVDDYGFPDQPLLEEMTAKAIEVLEANSPNGFVLMVEGSSIDKQAHNMDSERWILDTIEFDKAVGVAQRFAKRDAGTVVLVTSDHECAGVAVIGGSRVTDAALQARIGTGGGAAQVRNGVVGTYESAGFPNYQIDTDGYPADTDPDFKMLIGYAANADRFEDWRTNAQPLRDSQQPGNAFAPLNTYPSGPLNRDTAGNFLVTGQIADVVAAHTGNDIPLSACGQGALLFGGTMDNTDVFFKLMQAAVGGAARSPTFNCR